MKTTSLLLLLSILSLPFAYSQRSYKFYDEQDSIDYHHYNLITTKGYRFTIEDGKLKKIIVDSSYLEQNNYISYDSANQLKHAIPKFEYYQRDSNPKYTSKSELEASQQPDTITHLSFEGKQLRRLPLFKILRCKNLKEIELVNTSVKKIPWLLNWSIFGIDSLKTIRIYNHASNKGIKFKKNTQIKELVYRDSPYAPLPKNFYKLRNVQEIDFARNDFQDNVEFHLEKLSKLEHLNISRNSIDINNLAADTVHHLKHLVLSFNDLTSVPSGIGLLKDLVDLQLAENEITSEGLNSALGSLQKLEVLSFYKNDLDSLPPYLFNLQNLIELDLYYNSIEKIPDEIGRLEHLERLYLAYNELYKIPESVGKLRSLKEFYVHHNRISYLPESISNLKQITDFHIHNNYFQGFPKFILNYQYLEDLDISFNDIHKFPKELLNLQHLKFLWMRGITFEVSDKTEAKELKHTLETLQENGVKVSIELDQDVSP